MSFMKGFTLRSYRNLLAKFRSWGYEFRLLNDLIDDRDTNCPFVFIRHDVDIDLRAALDIARLEHREGIHSVFFLCPRSPFYSPLSHSSAQIIHEIYELGHVVAAHTVKSADHDLLESMDFDIKILSEKYPFLNPDLISFHSVDFSQICSLMYNRKVARVYAPILNEDLHYASDSTGIWQSGHVCNSEAFRRKQPIHLLIHPFWWVQRGSSPLEKLRAALSVHVLKEYKQFLPKLLDSNKKQ